MKICPVEAVLFHADRKMGRWTDRPADRHANLIVAFQNFENALKN
jgi:hypothetical protein